MITTRCAAGRYPFAVHKYGSDEFSSDHVIFRRNVCRWDYSDTLEPLSCFVTYSQEYIAFQNNIAIDGLDIKGQDADHDGLKGFFTAHGGRHVYFNGNIVLNMAGAGFVLESTPVVEI